MMHNNAQDRLTLFLYILTRDSVAWGEVHRIVENHVAMAHLLKRTPSGVVENNVVSDVHAWDMAQSMAAEIIGDG